MAHIGCTLYYTLYTMCIHNYDNDVENCLLSLCGPEALSCLYSIERDKTRNVAIVVTHNLLIHLYRPQTQWATCRQALVTLVRAAAVLFLTA